MFSLKARDILIKGNVFALNYTLNVTYLFFLSRKHFCQIEGTFLPKAMDFILKGNWLSVEGNWFFFSIKGSGIFCQKWSLFFFANGNGFCQRQPIICQSWWIFSSMLTDLLSLLTNFSSKQSLFIKGKWYFIKSNWFSIEKTPL